MTGYTPLPHDSVAPPPSGILPNTSPDSHAVWTIDVDSGSGQRHGDAVMAPDTPPPPPEPEREPITVTTAVQWANLNDYKVGSEVFADVAAFAGGDADETIYRYRWQTKTDPDDTWVNGKWTNYNDHALEVSTTITDICQIRFQCQARDATVEPVDQVNSFTSAQTVEALPLVVGSSLLTGEPFVGETITATQPTVSGGRAPYSFSYMWLDQAGTKSSSNSTVLMKIDEEKMVSAYITVTDANGDTAHTTSNAIGPVGIYNVGEISMKNSSTDADIVNGSTEELLQGVSATYLAEVDGDMPFDYLLYEWKVRSGSATIRGDTDLPYCSIQLPTEYPGSSSISCSIWADTKYESAGAGFMWTIRYLES
jgi:hypothetical protein